jgi:UDP-N-acetylglucosamine transferase subunit ALG13
MIFVTIGTQIPFDRLIEMLDRIAPELHEDIYAQVLKGKYKPKHIKTLDFISPDEFEKVFAQARLIVAHAGMGTILSALRKSKPLIILPRLASLGEHRNEHQTATARMMKEKNYAYVATDEKELRELLHKDLHPLKTIGEFASESLVMSLKDFIDFNV